LRVNLEFNTPCCKIVIMYIINALWTQRQKLLLTTFKKCDDIESSALTYVEFTKAPLI